MPTADLSELYESRDESIEQSSNIQRRFDDELPAEEEVDWQPALIAAEQQPTVGFVVSATQTFSEDDTVPAVDRRNDWKSIETDVQSPVLQVQRQFTVDQVTGEVSDRPHYEPWIQRERFVTSTQASITTTQRFNKSYRKPFVSSRRSEEQKSSEIQAIDNGRTANLRNILKQTGGLSLSEILQQQNLSLEDLLKGKQNAIKALQNTAAPPPTDQKESGLSKSSRRLPSMTQLNVVKPRRNFFNGTTRVTNANKAEIGSTPTVSRQTDDFSDSTSNEMTERRIASTIPTYFVEGPSATSKYSDESGVRRIPSTRGKIIKEVVPGIRPDFDNSNLRKRMPNIKFLPSKFRTTSTAETMSSESTISKNENIDNEKKSIESINTEEKLSHSNAVISSTTESEPISTTTQAVPKMNLRERLAFRPPRLRNIPSSQQSSTSSVEPSSTQPSSEITSTKTTTTTTSEESLPYTIITFTTQSNDQKPTESSEVLGEGQPVDDLNKRLNESVPELNLVDLEDESKSKEVTSLEDLFISDSMDPDSNKNTEELDNEFIHASSTSRSDHIYKADKPNSLKIFGGNLVNIIRKSIDKLDVTERNPGLFTDVTARYIDDKTELMDLLNDRRSGARLVKVLRQRNMTVDELLEHRKRGSSQVHLAEIFYNRSKSVATPSSTPPTEPRDAPKVDVVTAFKNFPDFNLENVKSVNPDEIKTDSQGSSYFTSITNIEPTAEIIKESRTLRKPFVIKLAESATRHNIPTQLWNTEHEDSSSPRSEHNFLDNSSPSASLFLSKQHVLRPLTGDETNINTAFHDVVDQNRNDAAARSHDPLDLELSGHGYKRNSVLIENAQMPIGVRSAIVASASIVLISLTIFFIIFMVCRWRQRRKRKICYSDRFQALRGRLPILGSRDVSPSKRSTSPAIAYLSAANSSRRSSKLNTMDPNSPEVQEYLYDAMRKPFQ